MRLPRAKAPLVENPDNIAQVAKYFCQHDYFAGSAKSCKPLPECRALNESKRPRRTDKDCLLPADLGTPPYRPAGLGPAPRSSQTPRAGKVQTTVPDTFATAPVACPQAERGSAAALSLCSKPCGRTGEFWNLHQVNPHCFAKNVQKLHAWVDELKLALEQKIKKTDHETKEARRTTKKHFED